MEDYNSIHRRLLQALAAYDPNNGPDTTSISLANLGAYRAREYAQKELAASLGGTGTQGGSPPAGVQFAGRVQEPATDGSVQAGGQPQQIVSDAGAQSAYGTPIEPGGQYATPSVGVGGRDQQSALDVDMRTIATMPFDLGMSYNDRSMVNIQDGTRPPPPTQVDWRPVSTDPFNFQKRPKLGASFFPDFSRMQG